MGLRETLSRYFGRKAQELHPHERVGEFGLKLLSDQKLMERIGLVDLLYREIDRPIEQVLSEDEGIPVEKQTPMDRLRVSRNRAQILNRLMKVASVPYARAGDQERYRKAMLGWEFLYSISHDIIATVESILKSASEEAEAVYSLFIPAPEAEVGKGIGAGTPLGERTLLTLKINIAELVRKLESFLNIELYAYGHSLMNSAYFDKDVAASYASVIVTPMIGSRPMTTLQAPRSFEESSGEALGGGGGGQLPGPPPVQDWDESEGES